MTTTPNVQLSLHLNMTYYKKVETYNIQYVLKLVLVQLTLL